MGYMLVDSEIKFKNFLEKYKTSENVIISPILKFDGLHPVNNDLLYLAITLLNNSDDNYYFLPFNSIESRNLNKDCINKISECTDINIFTMNKKILLKYFINNLNIKDINIILYYNNIDLNLNDHLEIKNLYTRTDHYIINIILPLTKVYDKYKNFNNNFNFLIKKDNIFLKKFENEWFFKINDIMIPNLYKIEQNGVHVDSELLLKYYPHYKKHIVNGIIYTDYNIYTLTGRPSNKFDKLNFSALNNNDGIRKTITSRYGKDGVLIYLDYVSYHLSLLMELIDYKLEDGYSSIYEYLGKNYFYNKTELTEDEYNNSKILSFNLLYGYNNDSIKSQIPFFNKILTFINEKWEYYNKNKYINTILFNRPMLYDKRMTKNKLFNYLMQSYETERNTLIINDINNFLNNTQSKLILYIYDGFLFDFHKNDIKILKNMLNLLENHIYKCKIYYGDNFHELKIYNRN